MRIEQPTDEERGAFKLREAEAVAHLHPGVDKLLAAERRATVERIRHVATTMREVVAVERNGKHEGIPNGWLNTIDQWAALLLDEEADRE